MVYVRDMVVGKRYMVNNVPKTLIKSELLGSGTGTMNQEPAYNLYFDDGDFMNRIDWDRKFDEVTSGGKRKTRRHRQGKKSRKNRRKSNRRR